MTGLETRVKFRPRLLFAHVDSAHAAQCSRFFRRQGWEVHLVTSAEEVHHLVEVLNPHVVVVDVDLPDESGWLTSAKNLMEDQERRFILLGDDICDTKRARAEQLGVAALIDRHNGPEALAEEIQNQLGQPA